MPRSRQLRLRRSKLTLVALFAGLALLTANLVADHLGLKYLHPDNKRWYTSAYAQQKRLKQRLDLVILGTSKARFGINAIRVAEALADEGHGTFEAFNLAQPAGSAVRNAAMLRDLIEANGCPSVVVLGVTRVGLHPDGIWWPLLGDYATPRDLPVLARDLVTLEHANNYLASSTRGLERFYDYLFRRPGEDEVELEIHRRGSQYRDHPGSFPRLERELDLAPPTGESPPLKPNIPAFQLTRAPKRALEALADSARRCSAQLVLVYMPTAPILSRPHLTHFQQQLQSEMERFAARTGAVFVDLNLIDLGLTTDLFRDWNHLNYEGAEVLSDYLARQVIAPALEARRQSGIAHLSDPAE